MMAHMTRKGDAGKFWWSVFIIFLPFLVLDMIVANVLLALGMQTLSPSQVSLPFKILLFVAVDGWALLARGLILGYR